MILVFIFQIGQNSFSCGHPFGLFWSVKYLNFGQKLPIQTADHTFQESRHPEVTKNPYHVLSLKGSQKKISACGLIPVYGGVYIHYFKINSPTFCCPLFSENYHNPQVRINKMVNKHTVDYHPNPPSQLISSIQLLIFLWTPKGFIYPESFSDFFVNLYIPPWLRKSFKFIVLRLLQIHL